MRYNNIIWDFDGTLYDSYPHITAAYLDAFSDFGRHEFHSMIYSKLKILFAEAHKHYSTPEEILQRFSEYEADITLKPIARPFPGIVQFLGESSEAGARHFIYTNRDKLTFDYLNRDNLTDYFTEIITEFSEHYEYKPDPRPVKYLLDKYGIDNDDAIMVGDREIDVKSGIDAGIHGLLLDSFGILKNTSSDNQVYSVDEMLDFLRK